eukprot:COSAG02_NODE_31282_length_536_cov_0.892449_2_plen_115_part_00
MATRSRLDNMREMAFFVVVMSVALESVNVGLVSQVGAVADVTLWDLSSLALLPKTDPLSLLILGSRTQAVGAGSTLTDSWVRLPLVCMQYVAIRLALVGSTFCSTLNNIWNVLR